VTFSALDSALLGPLFASAEMRYVFSDEARLEAMLRVEQALARAEAEHGIAPAGLADAIGAITPRQFDIAALGEKTALAGVPTIPFVAALQKLLPEDLRGYVHKGATTQDIVDTALVLQLRDAFALLQADLFALIDGLKALGLHHAETPCAGRTLGQQATPVTFGFKVAVWLTGIANAASALPALKERVLKASLGGPVGTLASLGEKGPAIAETFARELGLQPAPIAWHAIRSPMAETGAWLVILLGALAKMADDVIFLSSTEVGEVAEPHIPGRGGSSAMPHKRNPVSSIVILAAQAAAKAHVVTLFDAMISAQERSPGRWQAEWLALPQLFGLASGALREAASLAKGLEVYPQRMMKNLNITGGLLFAEAAAARLSAKLGRIEAHALIEEAARQVRDTGKSLQAVLKEPAFVERMQGMPVDEAFDLKPFVDTAAFWVRTAIEATESADALRRGGGNGV